MANLEEHCADQAEITALCEAGACDHPECQSDDKCRTCGEAYADGGDGYDGECPDCADKSYMNEIVTRSAPRWAWDLMDETLEIDAGSGSFSKELRDDISAAMDAMIMACEDATDRPISKEKAKVWRVKNG